MKKIFSAIVAVTLAVVMCMSVSAAGGLNDNEKAVLDKLKNSKVVGANGWSFSIPTEYINTVENYFNNIDMTASQKDTILAKIDEGMDIVKTQADGQNFNGTTYDLKLMDTASKRQVLQLGQEACAAVSATLTYDASANKVIIKDAQNTVIFTNTPVVKTTGQDFPITAAAVFGSVFVVVICGAVVLFAVSKKKGLLVK